MKSVAGVKLCRSLCAVAWTVINLVALWALYRFPRFQVAVVLTTVVVASPAYVFFTHWLDVSFEWLGLRSLGKKVKDKSSDRFRRTLRLEMLVITSGFAATFLFLSIQLFFELGPERRPPLILEAMIVLFFWASLLNLLQIILYDFRLATWKEQRDSFSPLRDCLDSRLRLFRDLSWHALVIPVVLAFSLINFYFCLIVNLLYGLMLFAYYSLTGDEHSLDFYHAEPKKPELSG